MDTTKKRNPYLPRTANAGESAAPASRWAIASVASVGLAVLAYAIGLAGELWSKHFLLFMGIRAFAIVPYAVAVLLGVVAPFKDKQKRFRFYGLVSLLGGFVAQILLHTVYGKILLAQPR